MIVFDGFPGDVFFIFLEAVLVVSIVSLLFGYYTRIASVITGVSLLVGFGFLYSLGKINHNIFIILVPLAMAGSNWGNRWSLDALHERVLDRKPQGWPLAVIAASLASAMFIAGAGKLIAGWLDPSLQATQAHLVDQFFQNGRRDLLAPVLLSFDNDVFWELQDWATVILEVGFLGAALRLSWIRGFMVAAVFFHLGVALSLNIAFAVQIPVYALFVDWSQFVDRGYKPAVVTKVLASQQYSVGVLLIVAIIYYLTGPLGSAVDWWIQFDSGMRATDLIIIVLASVFAGGMVFRSILRRVRTE
jgi:hypothetical protein